MAATGYEKRMDYGSLVDDLESTGKRAFEAGISATIRHARELRNHGGKLLNALLDHGSALVNRESVPDEVHAQRTEAWQGLRSNAGRLALAGALLGGGYLTLRAIEHWRNGDHSDAPEADTTESSDTSGDTSGQPPVPSGEAYVAPASAVVPGPERPATFHLRYRTDHNAPAAEAMKLEGYLSPLAKV